MLFGRLVALIYGGVLVAPALTLVAPDGEYSYSVTHQSEYGSDTQQVPFVPQKSERRKSILQAAEDKTIYQILSENKKFSKLVKVINISEEVVTLLNDTAAGITFFAPPNHAIRSPHNRKRSAIPLSPASFDEPTALLQEISSYSLVDIASNIEEIEATMVKDNDEERWKNFIKIIVRAILNYHILPEGVDTAHLVENTTYPTQLTIPDDALDKEALRIRVSSRLFPFPSIRVNFFSKIIAPDVRAKNGLIHVIDHPLLPPPSIFQELFFFTKAFGTVTSALQRVNLMDEVEWRYIPSDNGNQKWRVQGTGSTTFFVPSNQAFQKLPHKLQLFLFSPFGERALKKLLEYHIVPGVVLHSDYLHNATSGETTLFDNLSQSIEDVRYSTSDILHHDEDLIFNRHHHHHHHHHHQSKPPYWTGEGEAHERGDKQVPPRFPQPPPCPGRGWPPSPRKRPGVPRPPPPPPPGPHPPAHPHCMPPPPYPPHDGPRESGDGEDNEIPCRRMHRPRLPHPHPVPVLASNVTLPTLLTNHTLQVHVVKFKIPLPLPGKDAFVSKIFVNNQTVAVSDVVSRNGAVHVINKVLNPHPQHHLSQESQLDNHFEDEEDDWENWEEWLPQWAEN